MGFFIIIATLMQSVSKSKCIVCTIEWDTSYSKQHVRSHDKWVSHWQQKALLTCIQGNLMQMERYRLFIFYFCFCINCKPQNASSKTRRSCGTWALSRMQLVPCLKSGRQGGGGGGEVWRERN